MKKILVLFLGLMISLSQLFGQRVEPVKWQFSTVKINDSIAELQIKATIQKHWHLYAMSHFNGIEFPIEFTFKAHPNYKLVGKTQEPKPIVFYDPDFGDTSRYFEHQVTFKQRVKILTGMPFEIKGELTGQACIEGRCVAIDTKTNFEITGFNNIKETILTEETPQEGDSVALTSTTPANADTTVPVEKEEEESLWKFFFSAILGGLIGLLMPCVFPMIPMTVSYFMKSKNPKVEASFYGLSIVVIFIIIGVGLSLIFGPGISNILSTHWIPNLLFAAIFIVFAISLLGYFEIALPSKWVNKSSKMEQNSGLIGIFFMALTLVLVSFSCTLPIAGAVALNSADGSFLKPILGMLGFSLGIAVPFTFFAFFPGLLKKLPKSGGWMNTLKVTLAFVELAFALKFINVPDQTYHWGILDREVYLSLWIVLFFMLGLYLLGRIRFPHDDEMPVQKSWVRYFLSIGVFAFVVYLIPGMFGAPLKAISGWLPPMTTQDFDFNYIVRTEAGGAQNTIAFPTQEKTKYSDRLDIPHGIYGYFDYQQAIAAAKAANKPIFLDFTGHGCVNCRNVEAAVWVDQKVRQKFADELIVTCLFVDDKTIVLDAEDQIKNADLETITMLGKKNMYIQQAIYNENSQPCYFVIDHDGTILAGPVYYERDVNKYLEFLNQGINAYRERHP
ncbi:MAG: thioredoxin family protein [Bacteroidales bacterium]|nr:thioredoxin family protein [Bacteroidales bacterium]